MINHSFFRFLLVGVANTAVGLSSIYILLHWGGLGYWPATFLGNAAGALVSYFLNRTFTFRSSEKMGSSSIRFVAVIFVCYYAAYSLGRETADFLANTAHFLPSLFQKDVSVLAGTVLYTLFNYLGQRNFVFRKKEERRRHACIILHEKK
ncbi:GtrA family protein [Fictibacillus enclensis]|uniref:GtrA family protein n=1 Tax=Fictibacillus enclensis TaxID=1017270 RepID=UPI00333B4551